MVVPRSFDHVILTRFNLPTSGVEGLIRARDGWLADRVELFETYTVPSIAAQTKTPVWLVYFDPASPDWLLERLRPWREKGIFTALKRESVGPEDLRRDLLAHGRRQYDRLLTTNLDNDDGLAIDFCERLADSVTPRSLPEVIYWPAGLIRRDVDLYLRRDRRNAFPSVLETWESPVTSWSEYHNEFPKVMSVNEVKAPPGWLQVVHGSNVSNRVRGRLVSAASYADRFGGILDGVAAPHRTQVLRDALVGYPARTTRDAVRSGARVAGLSLLGKERYQAAKATVSRLGVRRHRH